MGLLRFLIGMRVRDTRTTSGLLLVMLALAGLLAKKPAKQAQPPRPAAEG
jgi:hypothetical protein